MEAISIRPGRVQVCYVALGEAATKVEIIQLAVQPA